jgi:DNA-binding MarR family transcriptional regulator
MNYIARLSRVSAHVMTLTGFFHGVIRPGPRPQSEAKTNVVRYHILKCLERRGSHNLTAISSTLNVKKNTLSELLDRMVRDGLVRRSFAAEDRRKVILAITAAGRAAMKQFEESLLKNIGRFLKTLDEDDRRDLVGAIEALIRILMKLEHETPGRFPS